MSKKEGLLRNNRIISLLSGEGGFTLVEIIVGVLMFSIMILAIFQMFAFSTYQNHRTNQLDELYAIAQRSMEYIKNNVVITESTEYQQLFGYTADTATQNRFTVIYKAEKIAVETPYGEGEIITPVVVSNFNVTIEVFYTRDRDALGALGTPSKVPVAQQKNIPIIILNSKLTQYQ